MLLFCLQKKEKLLVEIANKEMRKIKGGMFMYVTGFYPWFIKWFLNKNEIVVHFRIVFRIDR